MHTVTSVEAQSRFGELIDRAQREPIQVTRHGRTVAYVVSEHDMRELVDIKRRQTESDDKARKLQATLVTWNDFNVRHGAFADEYSTL